MDCKVSDGDGGCRARQGHGTQQWGTARSTDQSLKGIGFCQRGETPEAPTTIVALETCKRSIKRYI